MLRRDSFKSPVESCLEKPTFLDLPTITMTLGGSVLKFDDTWKLENTEFDKAAIEIEKIMNERDSLFVNLREATKQIKNLREEIEELQQMQKTTLDMLLEEKQNNNLLSQRVDAYKAELENKCKEIAELSMKLNENKGLK